MRLVFPTFAARGRRFVFAAGVATLLLSSASFAFAAPQDFNALPGRGLEVAAYLSDEISIASVSLASETKEPDGRIRLEFNLTLQNHSIGYFEAPRVRFDSPGPGWNVEIVRHGSAAALPDLPPSGSASTTQTLVLLAPAADAESVKAQVLARQRMTLAARELHQFRLPPIAVDLGADAAFTSIQPRPDGKFELHFSKTSPALDAVQPGMLFMEGALYSIGSGKEPPSELYQHIKNGIPDGSTLRVPATIEETRMFEITEKLPGSDGEVILVGIRFGESTHTVFPHNGTLQNDPKYRGLIDNLRTGSFEATANTSFSGDLVGGRHPYDPPIGNSAFTPTEIEMRSLSHIYETGTFRSAAMRDLNGLFCRHFPFNDVQLAPGVTLGGQFTLNAIDISMLTRFRDGEAVKIAMTMTTAVDIDLRLTVSAGANNLQTPELQRQIRLVTSHLPWIIFSIGDVPILIEPLFTIDVGATLDVPTSVVIPLQSSARAGVRFVWDLTKPEGERFSHEPVHQVEPLALSDPMLSEALVCTATVFVQAGLELRIDGLVGPHVDARVTGTFRLAPLETPWWSIEADLDIIAGVRLSLLGAELADIDRTLQGPVLFDRVPEGGPPSGSGGPLDPAEGDHLRWARGTVWDGGAIPVEASLARVAGTAEEVFAVLPAQNSLYSPIFRINALGEIVWTRSHIAALPRALAATPDGGLVLVGNYSTGHYLTRIDGAGNEVWSRGFDLTGGAGETQNVSLESLLVREAGPGQWEIFIAGYRDEDLNTLKTNPFLLKYDGAGNLVFAKHYAAVDAEYPEDAIILPDGDLLFAGRSKTSPDNVNPPGAGTADGGWIMKVTPAGDFIAAAQSTASLGLGWLSVTAAPDGRIFCAGSEFHSVLFDTPALAIGRYTIAGDDITLERLVTVGEVMPTDESLQHGGMYADWLPNAGRTLFDQATKVAWSGSGLIAGGITALGNERAPLLMNFNDKLALRWFTTHEGAYADTLFDFVPTEEGIVTAGFTNSMTGIESGQAGACILKVPYEGKFDLHPGVHATAKYLYPSVYNLKDGFNDPGIPSPITGYTGTLARQLTALPQVVVNTTAPPPLQPYALSSWTALQQGDPTAPMTFAQWAAYHQLPAGSNSPFANPENDARNNFEEWFFGGDPYTNQNTRPALSIVRRPDGGIRLGATRSLAARHVPFSLQFSIALGGWQDLPSQWQGPEYDADSSALSAARYYLDLAPDIAVRRFFRLRQSVTP